MAFRTVAVSLCALLAIQAIAAASVAQKVRVDFYQESGCPDCQGFIQSTLNTTLLAPGVPDILDFHLYPWGNAYFNIATCGASPYYDKSVMFCWVKACGAGAPNPPVDCFSAPILCQHGDDECAGNNLEMCAVSLYPPTDSAAAAMSMAQFVYCFEIDNALNLAAAPGCAAYAGFDISALMTCFNDSARVQQLQQQFAAETAALGVAKLGVPWVLVNNATLDDTTQFLQAVCAAWTGAKPAGCP